jgi:hypothetical protein
MAIIHESVFRSKRTDLPDEPRKMAMAGTGGVVTNIRSMPTFLNNNKILLQSDFMVEHDYEQTRMHRS